MLQFVIVSHYLIHVCVSEGKCTAPYFAFLEFNWSLSLSPDNRGGAVRWSLKSQLNSFPEQWKLRHISRLPVINCSLSVGALTSSFPKVLRFAPSSFALWAQEAEGLYNLGLNGVTLMSESFTYLIEVSLFYSLFLCTGAEKMVCSQRRTEAGASHFFGLCTVL